MGPARLAQIGVAAGLTATAVVRRGAFFYPDSVVLTVALLMTALLVGRAAGDRRLIASVAAFAAWWLALAYPWPVRHRIVLLPASLIGFVAAWLVARVVVRTHGRPLRCALLAFGIGLAAIGLAGVVLRIWPLAMPHDGLWRAASTLSYANAAGLVMAMFLPLAIAGRVPVVLQRLALFALSACLVASGSRGGLVAGVVALALTRDRIRQEHAHPLLLGSSTGAMVLFTSSGGAARPWVGLLALAAAVAAGTARPARAAQRAGVGALLFVLVVGVAAGLSGQLATRVDPASVGERWNEWHAAAAQFADDPVIGAGPEELLVVHPTLVTYFAHNEYLQVAAGAGLIGLALLAWCMIEIARRTCRGTAAAPVRATLVAVLVAGLFDFTWHLPAVGMLAGWLAVAARGDE